MAQKGLAGADNEVLIVGQFRSPQGLFRHSATETFPMTMLLRKTVRRAFCAVCLLPVSVLVFPRPRNWCRALGRPRHFFQTVLAQSESLAARINGHSFLVRLTLGLPLRLARAAAGQTSLRLALRRRLQEQAVLRHLLPCFARIPRPGLVALLDGLTDPASSRHAQAVTKARTLVGPDQPARTVAGDVRVHFDGGPCFADTVTAVVAHWDPQGIVDPYVRHMCRQFKTLGWNVVLISGGPIRCEATPDWADVVLERTCAGYDFTSWKAALAQLPGLFFCRELVLCNDSVFGGLGSYARLHETMAALACDFWGITESHEIMPHLQSYYLVFRATALRHPAFAAFFDGVPLSNAREDAIRCETRLALCLALHGLQPAAFFPLAKTMDASVNPSCELWKAMLLAGAPVLKRELLYKNERRVDLSGWLEVARETGYPVEYSIAYCNRLGLDITAALHADTTDNVWPPCVQQCYRALPQHAEETAPPRPSGSRSPTIGAFIHIYYTELTNEIISCLRHLPASAHVYISTDTAEKKQLILHSVAESCLENKTICRVCPNIGWDIAPFLVGFADVLPGYDLILRLHAKRSLHLPAGTGDAWRQLLYAALAGSREQVGVVLDQFAGQEDLGLIAPPLLPQYATSLRAGNNFTAMRALLARYGVRLRPDTPLDFPMGSMFWCRPQVLAPWLRLGLRFDDFQPTDAAARDGDLAHALERLFFFGCALEGFSWTRIMPQAFLPARQTVFSARTCETALQRQQAMPETAVE